MQGSHLDVRRFVETLSEMRKMKMDENDVIDAFVRHMAHLQRLSELGGKSVAR